MHYLLQKLNTVTTLLQPLMSSSPEAEQPVILEPEELVLDEPQQGTSVSHSTQPGTSASHSTQPGTSTSHTTEPIGWSTLLF
jgi:hypothetical protein